MTLEAPRVDHRTASEVVDQVGQLLKAVAPELDPTRGFASALANTFGRFAEILIERLNQVPQKNFLAFLDLLGASLTPPQPARVPLTFSLAAGSAADGVVPPGTQVAAAPAEGEKNPVIFETERELTVTAAQLSSIFVRNPDQDKYADLSFIAGSTSEHGVPAFLGNRDIEHAFYIGHRTLFSHPGLSGLTLTYSGRAIQTPNPFTVAWEIWDGAHWTLISPDSTTTSTVPRGGITEVVFTNLLPFVRRTIAGSERGWLRCRLLTPITPSAEKRQGMVRAIDLPAIEAINIKATSSRNDLPIDSAFTNSAPVDTTKEFFPFGEKPRVGDALYLAVDEAFSDGRTNVTVSVMLSNPEGAVGSSVPPTTFKGNPVLRWESWDGRRWVDLIPTSDTTNAFTKNGEDGRGGIVKFVLPARPVARSINGVESFWVRVRILSGNYGSDARYDPIDANARLKEFQLTPATYAPPSISAITVDYTVTESSSPDTVLADNDFEIENVTGKQFSPFRSTRDIRPTIHFGFELPAAATTFPNRKISIFAVGDEYKQGEQFVPVSPLRSSIATAQPAQVVHRFLITNPSLEQVSYVPDAVGTAWDSVVQQTNVEVDPGSTTDLVVAVTIPPNAQIGESDRGFLVLRLKSDPAVQYAATFETFVGDQVPAGERPQLSWQYSSREEWSTLLLNDESESFGRSGLFEFLGPSDFRRRTEFGLDRFWVRAVWTGGRYWFDPVLHRLLLNTITASQAVTIKNELVGSSDGTRDQVARASRAPVLAGEQLEVREPEMPPAAEQVKIKKQEGDDAISIVKDQTGRPKEIWVRWSRVPDFHGSGARDRHYVIDYLTGEVRFGDGLSGMIPPVGSGNIRLARYRSGGGASGNKAAGAISQLKTTVPYVEKATNHLAATGGADAETFESLLERAPRAIRHRGRAVTVEDFEDLAMLASSEVARSRCVPNSNLASDPDGSRLAPGTVSLIIVPRSAEARPSPGLELIRRVSAFIEARQIPVADLVVVGPQYTRVSVEVGIALASLEGAGEVALAVSRELSRFLHPITGGLDGTGWDFGRKPHKSDLYALIEAIPGVDHVRLLDVVEVAEGEGATDRFLVYSGTHKIDLNFEEA
ncbi:MAG TPA: putative baseplate assembly protein [Blastocatellia bacterium]|nr:putative baseplate assembly protein [Blastocatellia bacterium]